MAKLIGFDGVPISVGDRVELHPATDLWMRGARFGEAVKIIVSDEGDPPVLKVKLDKLPREVCRVSHRHVKKV